MVTKNTNLLIMLITLLAFSSCKKDAAVAQEPPLTNEEILINNSWKIESIIVKKGTHDPDANVPEEDASTACKVDGVIIFLISGKLEIYDGNTDCVFGSEEGLTWKYDNSSEFITFRRETTDGAFLGKFGYKVIHITSEEIKLYQQGTGIETGPIQVRITTLISI
ncbi:MAG: hypothetical protein FVQ77_03515 [Cytophagales bacterium]|nr:hypothetical protein [Cytophagales bacterium]